VSDTKGVLSILHRLLLLDSIALSGDRWPDDVRLSDLEPRFTCQACGRRARARIGVVEISAFDIACPLSVVRAEEETEPSPRLADYVIIVHGQINL
jgi:hypothetical protein